MNLIYQYPEFTIFFINTCIITVFYFFVYKKSGKKLQELAKQDMVFGIISLLIAGSLYGNSDIKFTDLNLNWFFFSIISYIIIELGLFYGKDEIIGLFMKEVKEGLKDTKK